MCLLGARRPQHARRFSQAGVEAGEMDLFPGCVLQAAGSSELNAVVAAQGKGVGILAGLFPQQLGNFDGGITLPIGAQAGADGRDGLCMQRDANDAGDGFVVQVNLNDFALLSARQYTREAGFQLANCNRHDLTPGKYGHISIRYVLGVPL